MYLKGLDKVLVNLNREIRKIEERSLKGLIRAAVFIRQDMEKTSPLTPLDWGNLRASWYVVTPSSSASQGGDFRRTSGVDISRLSTDHSTAVSEAVSLARSIKSPVVIMGYSAYYAVFVHEMVDAEFQRPGAGAKWFEAALNRNHKKILEIIKENVKIR